MAKLLVFLRMTAHTASVIWRTLIIASLVISQPPVPGVSEQVQAQGQQADANAQPTSPQDGEPQPSVTINISNQQTNADNPKNNADDDTDGKDDKAMNWWSTIVAILTANSPVVIAVFTILLALATGGLVWVGRQQRQTQQDTLDAMKAIERAYVRMSHEPPGITSFAPHARVSIRVENSGQTPATITDVLRKAVAIPNGQPLPSTPDYSTSVQREPVRVFLVHKGKVFYNSPFPIESEPPFTLGQNGTHTLHILGYVDYIDRFGDRHRASYARQYDWNIDNQANYTNTAGELDEERWGKRNNLPFVTQPGYNRDRKRERHEGNDWDEPTE